MDDSGNLYVSSNNRILKVLRPSTRVKLTVDKDRIAPDGADASTVQARLLNPDGSLRSDDNTTLVRFGITNGTGSLSSEEVMATGGIASTTLTSHISGHVVLQAGAIGAETSAISVAIGLEYYLHPPILLLKEGETSQQPLEIYSPICP